MKRTVCERCREENSGPDARIAVRRLGSTALSSVVWRIILAMAMTGMTIGVALGIWQNVRSHVQAQPEYLVSPSEIEITAAPPWIRADIKAEVIRDAGLSSPLSILDEKLAESLSRRFALHPWIQRVTAVKSSYPAKIKVELIYRKPVAMVEVHGGLLPVDVDAVLLPTEDFTPERAQAYPRIVGVESAPLGPLGTRWGDPIVEGAAKVAMLLSEIWGPLKLHYIQPAEFPNGSKQPALELVSRDGTVISWGSSPGQEIGAEAKVPEKLAILERWASGGTLETVPKDQRDLRRPPNDTRATRVE